VGRWRGAPNLGDHRGADLGARRDRRGGLNCFCIERAGRGRAVEQGRAA
jgi:hypothetical protein